MKKLKKNLYDALLYAQEHPEISLTSISEMFNIERHSLSNNKNIDLSLYKYFYENEYYYISDKEMIPVIDFLNNPDISLTQIAKRNNVKMDTIKRRLAVIGEKYEIRYQKKFNRNAFSNVQTEEEAYWLGFFLADGYINEERYFLRVKLGAIDKTHLNKLCNFMNSDPNGIKETNGGAYTKDNLCYYVDFNSKTLIQNLLKYNLFQNKSGKEIPYRFDSEELQKAYIRGMIDGDGHVEKNYFKYVGSLESCNYIKDFLNQYIEYNSDNSYIYKHNTIYSFELRRKEIGDLIFKIFYKNSQIYLDRKFNAVAV